MLTAAVGFWDLLFRFLPCQWFVTLLFLEIGKSPHSGFFFQWRRNRSILLYTRPYTHSYYVGGSFMVLLLTLQSIALAISLYYLLGLKDVPRIFPSVFCVLTLKNHKRIRDLWSGRKRKLSCKALFTPIAIKEAQRVKCNNSLVKSSRH